MKPPVRYTWLHRFAVLTAFCTLFLVCVGGLVTSKGVGMAVPDWPNTYGYNMFLFPVSKWVGGIFYEHTHRLVASGVGLFTTILAIWIGLSEPRKWVRVLGVVAFIAVVIQGVLGGLRVTLVKDELGIFHGTLAHLFFCLVALISLVTSTWWRTVSSSGTVSSLLRLRKYVIVATSLILGQLIIGATMRHQHAGLAIPDFPLAYGKLYPETSAEAVESYNRLRLETTAVNPITPFQIHMQMIHRFGAVASALSVLLAWKVARTYLKEVASAQGFAFGWVILVMTQASLGAFTVWSSKSADVATAHVAVGALTLMTGCLFLALLSRLVWVGRLSPAKPSPARVTSLLACSV